MPDWTNMDSYGFPVLSKTHYITCSTSRSGGLFAFTRLSPTSLYRVALRCILNPDKVLLDRYPQTSFDVKTLSVDYFAVKCSWYEYSLKSESFFPIVSPAESVSTILIIKTDLQVLPRESRILPYSYHRLPQHIHPL